MVYFFCFDVDCIFLVEEKQSKQKHQTAVRPQQSKVFLEFIKQEFNLPVVIPTALSLVFSTLPIVNQYLVKVIVIYSIAAVILLFYYVNKYLNFKKSRSSSSVEPPQGKHIAASHRASIFALCMFMLELLISCTSYFIPPKVTVAVGDIVTFGEYYQTSNVEKEAIDWIVLDVKDNTMLVTSKNCLDCKQFNEGSTSNVWASSTIRTWLNSNFFFTAFSSEIQNKVILTNTGDNIMDKVFLLSTVEADKYFDSPKAREATPTDYAVLQGAKHDNDIYGGPCWWWLRTPGSNPECVADIRSGGAINTEGYPVNSITFAVRPTLWVETSVLLMSGEN